jgi:hypothetical protein
MRSKLTLAYAFDWLFAAVCAGALVGVLQTFVIGRHFIIPTGILAIAVLTGNVAWYGLNDRRWAKQLLFWCGFLATCHLFFALFWAKRYRELLGDAFEPVCAVLTVLFAFLSWQYARRNRLFVAAVD